jgi:hypothetical protein
VHVNVLKLATDINPRELERCVPPMKCSPPIPSNDKHHVNLWILVVVFNMGFRGWQ